MEAVSSGRSPRAVAAVAAAVVAAAFAGIAVQHATTSVTSSSTTAAAAVADTFVEALERTRALPACQSAPSRPQAPTPDSCRPPGTRLALLSAGPRHASFLTPAVTVGDTSSSPVLVSLIQTDDALTVRATPASPRALHAGSVQEAGSPGRLMAQARGSHPTATLKFYGPHQEEILAPASGDLVPAELARVAAIEVTVNGNPVAHRWVFAANGSQP